MDNNYSVYQHVTPDGLYYFGQTNDIKRRWSGNGIRYKGTSLYPYIEKYGWDNIQHIVLFRDQTKDNALWIEDFLIETAREDGVCINQRRSGLVSKEEGYKQRQQKQYREQNKEQILEQKQQYYEQNKEQIREQQKQYREQNKEQIKKQQQQYYEQNKQQIKKQKQQYYEQNKQQRREYQRQYRERKKLEKQLKEVETTLF